MLFPSRDLSELKRQDVSTTYDKVSLAERIWIATKIYSSIQAYFGHWQGIPDFDLDAEYKNYIDHVVSSDDRMAFDLASMEFLAKLQNGHTSFSDKWLNDTNGQLLPFLSARISGKWVVTQTEIPDLAVGDVIESIDGVSMDGFFALKEKFVSGSSSRSKETGLFHRPYLFPQKFVLSLQGGKTVRIQRKADEAHRPATHSIEWRMLDSNTGYLRIPSFENAKQTEKAIDHVREHAEAKCIVIDLRGNGGGVTPVNLIRAFMDRPYRGWVISSAMSISLFGAYRQMMNVIPHENLDHRTRGALETFAEFDNMQITAGGHIEQPDNPIYKGSLFILTDSRCASACEDFIMPLKASGRARVIGQPTYGSSGQPYVFPFNNGMVLFVGSKRMFFPDGSPFEGVGIVPDVVVELLIDDIRNGKDSILDKALDLANTKTLCDSQKKE